jgi:hypothetical protein
LDRTRQAADAGSYEVSATPDPTAGARANLTLALRHHGAGTIARKEKQSCGAGSQNTPPLTPAPAASHDGTRPLIHAQRVAVGDRPRAQPACCSIDQPHGGCLSWLEIHGDWVRPTELGRTNDGLPAEALVASVDFRH